MITKKYYKLIKVSYADSDLFRVTNISDQAGTLTVTDGSGNLECSTDGVTWFSYTEPIAVAAGVNVYMKANISGYSRVSRISMNVNHNIGGNILSLVDKTNYATITTVPGNESFSGLFSGDTYLIDASQVNFGQVTTLGLRIMSETFKNCTSLVGCPDFSTITSLESAYTFNGTFENCTSLTVAPDFSNITSGEKSCFNNTFAGCTSLITGADISNIVMSNGNSQRMYGNCTALKTVYAPKASAWPTNSGGSFGWLYGVPQANAGTIYCPSQAVSDLITQTTGDGCPQGWTKVVM